MKHIIIFLVSTFCLLSTTNLYAVVGMERPTSTTCDKIILTNGDTLQAKIIKLTAENIVYKKCGQLDVLEYSVAKNEVASVIYHPTNGKPLRNAMNRQTVFNVIVGITVVGLVIFALIIMSLLFALVAWI
jgi:hypothetical protein